ncbi:patatin-like phospholipase family protein [Algoriphagus namhaensis]
MKNALLQRKHHFTHLFGDLDESLAEEIVSTGKALTLNTGDYLFHQGDQERILYLVLSGRLRAIKEEQGRQMILGDIGEGEPVGEFAVFTREPRMASVLAIRRSVVIEFTLEEYLSLVAKRPNLAAALTSFVIQRQRRNAFEQKKATPPKNIALVQLQENQDLSPWTSGMLAHFSGKNVPIQIHHSEDVADQDSDQFFSSLEQRKGLNIMVCGHSHLDWAKECLLYADLVVVATDFEASSELYPIEKELGLYSRSILNKKTYLLLLHREEKNIPFQTQRWFENRAINLHIHLRKNHQGDLQRFCRIITHEAVGLVLSGGGARGYAHLGAIKALQEQGITPDFLGGTSAGAIYGMTMNYLNFDLQLMAEKTEESIRRRLTSSGFALPIISMKTGKKIQKFLHDTFGESDIEDLWVNSYCVSTNFTKAKPKVHKRGRISQRVMASLSVPGIFPPVVIGDSLHVDGAVMDNLPIEPMYDYPVQKIIAISLSGTPTPRVNFSETPSGWQVLWDKIRGKKRYNIPGINSIMVNTMNLNNMHKEENLKGKATHFVQLDLRDFGFLDDKKWQDILEKGYVQTRDYLAALEGEDKLG